MVVQVRGHPASFLAFHEWGIVVKVLAIYEE
jgi:hypothetical protein